jgi:hypothetical protein
MRLEVETCGSDDISGETGVEYCTSLSTSGSLGALQFLGVLASCRDILPAVPSPASAVPSVRARWETALVLVLLLTLGLGLLARIVPALGARLASPTGAAQWIWEKRDRRDISPTAFYAVHDFDVETPPKQVRLLATADEEYVVYLNGRRVGAGSWEPGAPLDVYEVGPLLQPGPNRLLAELRSSRGAGGFLLSLEDDDGRQLAQSDATWRIFHEHHPGLVRGWLPLVGRPDDPPEIPKSEPAFCWGLPPTGTWGRQVVGTPRPPLFEIAAPTALPAASATAPAAPPQEGPPETLFDWGRQVGGYLMFDVPPAPEFQVGLLYTGDAPPDPLRDRPVASVLVMPRQRVWRAARPGQFRYALVVGIADPSGASVRPVDAALLPRLLPRAASPEGTKGVFGISPPPLRTPVEDKVWGKLKGVPGVAGREKL